MASKKLIDKIFTDNYDSILKETRYWVNYCSNATADAEDYIASAYQFVLNNRQKISDGELDVKNYIFRHIIDNVRWYNSSPNKEHRRINNGNYEFIEELTTEQDIFDEDYNLTDNDEYNCKIAAIDLYNQRASKEDKIVYQVYANKEKRTVRSLASHLNIKNTQSWIKICEMKTGIKDIYEELRNNKNK